jgi:hypothetical protein
MAFHVNDPIDPSGMRNPWFAPGRYRVRIAKLREVNSRKGFTFYVIDAELVEIYDTEIPEKMKVGRTYSQMIKFNEDMGPINVARFLLAAMGLDPIHPDNKGLIGEEEINASIDTQFCAEQEMDLDCVTIQTQSGNDFTEHRWHPYEDEEDEAAG